MHPYKDLPLENFWKPAITQKLWSDVDFKTDAAFSISPSDKIATAGSCFAQHIARRLPELGLTHHVAEPPPIIMQPARAEALQYGQFSARYGNIYTARQLRQLIEFAFGARERTLMFERVANGWADLLRPGIDAASFQSEHDLMCDREFHLDRVKAMFEEASIFVFTLGLTETWYDEPTGIVFPSCPGTRTGTYNPERHKFINAGVGEIVDDLRWCIEFIATINPSLKWIFTVSPVALAATATKQNVLVATSASKAILRVAAGQICDRYERCDYFPSFEIVASAASFGQFLDTDLRNISPRGVDLVMRNFQKAYLEASPASNTAEKPVTPVDDPEAKRAALVLAAVEHECDEAFNDPGRSKRTG